MFLTCRRHVLLTENKSQCTRKLENIEGQLQATNVSEYRENIFPCFPGLLLVRFECNGKTYHFAGDRIFVMTWTTSFSNNIKGFETVKWASFQLVINTSQVNWAYLTFVPCQKKCVHTCIVSSEAHGRLKQNPFFSSNLEINPHIDWNFHK